MLAEREPRACVVGDDVFTFGRRAQFQGLFIAGRALQERRLRLDARDLPQRFVPVAGDALQRAGPGESGEFAAIQRRAGCQVCDRCERGKSSCIFDSPGRRLPEPARHAQAEPDGVVAVEARFQRAVPAAEQDVDRQDLYAAPFALCLPGVLDELRG